MNKENFSKEIEEFTSQVKSDFFAEIDQIVKSQLVYFQSRISQEVKSIIKNTQYQNLKILQEELFGAHLLNRSNTNQILKKLSQFIMNKIL